MTSLTASIIFSHSLSFSEIYVDLVSVSRPCLAGRLFSGLELLG